MIALKKAQLDLSEWTGSSRRILLEYMRKCRSRVIRPMGQFAEDELVIVTHPIYEGMPFKINRQPWMRLWFNELEHGNWYEFCGTGPSQSGKSWGLYIIPIVYNLFELQRDVIAGVPTMEMGHDKWSRDLLPVIEKTIYRDLIPTKGAGSRGGFNGLITFKNGVSLKFMTAGGGDKSKASYTSPVLIFTEVDGYAATDTSDEAHPVNQIEARARSVSRNLRFVIKECTVTYEEGYIWKAIHRGSASKILLPCPKCKKKVTLERPDLKGWQDAPDEIAAEKKSRFHCYECGKPWTEKQRYEANLQAELLHEGQRVTKAGKIIGKPKPTRTLGFRFGAVNNMFLSPADLGMDEWEARRDDDEINAEKRMTQFVWAMPFKPPGLDTMVKIDRDEAEQRMMQYPKGFVPTDAKYLTMGIDVGKYRSDWILFAWLYPGRIGLIADYGRIEHKLVLDGETHDANTLGFRRVFEETMSQFFFGGGSGIGVFNGFASEGGELRAPDIAFIDARYQGDDPDEEVVYDCVRTWRQRQHGQKVVPILGHGQNQFQSRKYRAPAAKDKLVVKRGHYYDLRYDMRRKLHVAHLDSDAWKTIFQARLGKEESAAGSVVMYDSVNPKEHTQLIKEFDSERAEPSFKKGVGMREKWVAYRERNHKLDAAVYACVAGHYVGFRTDPKKDPKAPERKRRRRRAIRVGGRPYLVTQR